MTDHIFYEVQRGNKDAYKRMFLSYYSPLCEYASQFISDADAEELVQDLMLHIWEVRENIVIEISLKSYLFAAVRNRCFNAIRDRQYKEKVHTYLYDHLKDQFEDPDYYMIGELATRIQTAIEKLPQNQRKIFEMSRIEGKTNQQIAEEMMITIKTVEYHITQSLKILKTKLKDYLPLLLFILH